MEDSLLIALASTKVSCLHAFLFQPDPQHPDLPGSQRFGRQRADERVFTNPAFIGKNQRLESNPLVVIKSLCSFIASQEEPDNKLSIVCTTMLFEAHSSQGRQLLSRVLTVQACSRREQRSGAAVRQAYTSAGISQFIRGLVKIFCPRSESCGHILGSFQLCSS